MRQLVTIVLIIIGSALDVQAEYDPLLTAKGQPEQKDLVVKDEKRTREIPIRSASIYPTSSRPHPLCCLATDSAATAKAPRFSASTGRCVVMSPSFCNIRAATIASGKTNPLPSGWQL